VKLYSSNLLLMAAFLAAADARRLANVFLLNRPAEPAHLEPPRFQRRWLHFATMAFWILFVGSQLFGQLHGGWTAYKTAYLTPSRPPLYGAYTVEAFQRGSGSDDARWRKVDFQPQNLNIRKADDTVARYGMVYNARESTLTLDQKDTLAWSKPDASHLILKGTLDGNPISMKLRQVEFPLLNRGFHWINEFPFNR
jgi:hypothetical protein